MVEINRNEVLTFLPFGMKLCHFLGCMKADLLFLHSIMGNGFCYFC
jgi:hypothetical protein